MPIDGRKDRTRRKTVLEFLDYRRIFGKYILWGDSGSPPAKSQKLGKFGGFRKTAGSEKSGTPPRYRVFWRLCVTIFPT